MFITISLYFLIKSWAEVTPKLPFVVSTVPSVSFTWPVPVPDVLELPVLVAVLSDIFWFQLALSP